MDDESPLYLAHQKWRTADRHLKSKQFDDAVSCHEKASELLQQAMTLTKYAKALESLELQYHYHQKQTDIIKAKKLQLEIQQKVIELKKKKKMDKKALTVTEQRDEELQMAILKTMEEADSLLGFLRRRSERRAKDEAEDDVEEIADVSAVDQNFKHPKDEKTVVEELRMVNEQLRDLVQKLLLQLEESRKEVEGLKTRLKIYEDVGLPDLTPLELPNFDYSMV